MPGAERLSGHRLQWVSDALARSFQRRAGYFEARDRGLKRLVLQPSCEYLTHEIVIREETWATDSDS